MKKILAPVEFSARSVSEARHTIRPLAEQFEAEVTILHVSSETGRQGVPGAEPGDEADLDGFLAAELHEVSVRRVLLQGDPAQKIVETAQAGAFDLIVMPTHGYGPFRRLLLGSVTAKVLHDADCPVWTTAHVEAAPAATPVTFGHVACAIDLGAQSENVLRWADGFASAVSARLSLVHVVTSLDPRTESYYFSPEWRSYVLTDARSHVERLCHEAGVSPEMHIETGDVAQSTAHAVNKLGADLLVIGRSAKDGAAGRLPTNAYAIIRESPCPVVSI